MPTCGESQGSTRGTQRAAHTHGSPEWPCPRQSPVGALAPPGPGSYWKEPGPGCPVAVRGVGPMLTLRDPHQPPRPLPVEGAAEPPEPPVLPRLRLRFLYSAHSKGLCISNAF